MEDIGCMRSGKGSDASILMRLKYEHEPWNTPNGQHGEEVRACAQVND